MEKNNDFFKKLNIGYKRRGRINCIDEIKRKLKCMKIKESCESLSKSRNDLK